ncbi:alanine racemase [Candidatus Dojkabacteria bacterium]|nr:alanine racemase [Candidatus Dojkabacteria bacterium]
MKANAYGNGMLPIAKFLEHKKLCAYFGVAHTCEALKLRKNGISLPILNLVQPCCSSQELECIINNEIEQAVSDVRFLACINQKAAELSKKALIHLHIDTGMGRGGTLIKDFDELLKMTATCNNIKVVGVMTHFSVADSLDRADLDYTDDQIRKFKMIKQKVVRQFSSNEIIFHTSNSGGSPINLSSVFDMIRPRIAAYGYPEQDCGLGLEPIMELVSKITLIKKFPKGHSIGYGRTYKAKHKNERIAIVPIGYGDGLNRLLSNKLKVIVNGEFAQCVGRISMDQFAILVDASARVGDEVIIIGKSGKVEVGVFDLADLLGSISYEVLCSLGGSSRVRRLYVYGTCV